MIIQIPDSELVNAEVPDGWTRWSETATGAWLLSKGVDVNKLIRQWSDPKTRMHYYEVQDDE